MEANLAKLKEVENWLVTAHSCVLAAEVDRAAEEIKRLRASQKEIRAKVDALLLAITNENRS